MRTLPENCNTLRGLRTHFSVIAAIAVLLALLAGCAQVPVQPAHARRGVQAQPLARMDLPVEGGAGKASALLIAAEFSLQHGDLEGAVDDYANAAQLSRDPAVARRAVQLALANRDVATAEALLPRWQTLGADPDALAGARGQAAMLEGDRAAAEREFGQLLAAGTIEDWKTFAAALLTARDTALAGRVLEDLATPKRLPDDAAIWVAVSQLGEHLGRHDYARTLADEAAARFGTVISVRWAASLKLAVGDREGARALYARGVAAHPHDVSLRMGYASVLGNAGDYAAAGRVLAGGPQTPATWAARVAWAARANDKAALRSLYAQLRQVPPAERAGNAFLLGQLAETLDHDPEALQWYREVEPDDRDSFEAQIRIGVLLDKAGQQVEAHAVATRLQQDYADDADSLRTAYELDAQLYAQHGQHAQAIAAYNRGLEALPDDPALTYDRGIVRANAGDIDAALADFRSVLKADPGNIDAMNALGYTLADADRDLAEAKRLLGKALAAKPDAVAIMDSWGWLQYRLGNLDEAKDYLKRAWARQQDPDIGVHLGEVLWQLGQHGDAREVFAKVRKLDPGNAALASTEQRLRP